MKSGANQISNASNALLERDGSFLLKLVCETQEGTLSTKLLKVDAVALLTERIYLIFTAVDLNLAGLVEHHLFVAVLCARRRRRARTSSRALYYCVRTQQPPWGLRGLFSSTFHPGNTSTCCAPDRTLLAGIPDAADHGDRAFRDGRTDTLVQKHVGLAS